MDNISFVDNHVVIVPPKRTKKMTATRFASVLGLNEWATPFEMWCAICKVYEKPFEDTIYTKAGKVIEPKIIKYLQDVYFLDIKTPSDVYGEDYFKKTYGDFYGDTPIFGGMWDAKGSDVIVEIKTTKRAEDWLNDIPIYYKLQACLYAYLSGIDTVYFACGFLGEADYENPDAFVPTSKNTIVRSFSLSEEFPNFVDDYIVPAQKWWEKHVLTGESPKFDEKRDAEILKALRTNSIDGDASLNQILAQIDENQKILDGYAEKTASIEKEQKKLKDKLKEYLTTQFSENDTRVEANSTNYIFAVTKSEKSSLDNAKLKADGVYEKYLVKKTEYKMTVSKKK